MALYEFKRSDGDPSKWPEANKDIPATGKSMNRYVPSLTDTDMKYKYWLNKIGMAISVHLGKDMKEAKDDHAVAFPDGYRLFIHQTRSTGNTHIRKDAYLYGRADGGRYRSPNEFLTHAIWLYSDDSTVACNCGYCIGAGMGRAWRVVDPKDGLLKSVKEVDHQHSLSEIYRQLPNGREYIPAGISRPRRRVNKDGKGKGKARASAANALDEIETLERLHGVQVVSKLRSRDLAENRRFRQGEAVWVPIKAVSRPSADHPSTSSSFPSTTDPTRTLSAESQTIRYWPALIQSTRYNHPPVVEEEAQNSSVHPSSAKSDVGPFWSYRVNMFKLDSDDATPDYREDEILPFLAYVADHDVTDSVRLGLAHMEAYPDLKNVALSTIRGDWDQLIVYYAAALSCVEDMTKAWAFTNSYKVKPEDDHPTVREWQQGVWWGAERIWTGDLVRLIATHGQLALPVANTEDDDGLFAPRGDSAGPLFFSVEAMHVDPAGKKDEEHGLMKGRVYELVDADVSMDVDGVDQAALSVLFGSTMNETSQEGSAVPADVPAASGGASSEAGPSVVDPSPFKMPGAPASARGATPSAQRSGLLAGPNSPLLTDNVFPLPSPPAGKVFRLLHSPKVKITLAMSAVLAGRYYPALSRTVNFLSLDSVRSVDGTETVGNFAPPEQVARALRSLAGGSHEVRSEGDELRGFGGVFMAAEIKKNNRFEMVTDAYPAVAKAVQENWSSIHREGNKRPVVDSDDDGEPQGTQNKNLGFGDIDSDLDAEGEMEVDELDEDDHAVERPTKFARLDADESPTSETVQAVEGADAQPIEEVAMQEVQDDGLVDPEPAAVEPTAEAEEVVAEPDQANAVSAEDAIVAVAATVEVQQDDAVVQESAVSDVQEPIVAAQEAVIIAEEPVSLAEAPVAIVESEPVAVTADVEEPVSAPSDALLAGEIGGDGEDWVVVSPVVPVVPESVVEDVPAAEVVALPVVVETNVVADGSRADVAQVPDLPLIEADSASDAIKEPSRVVEAAEVVEAEIGAAEPEPTVEALEAVEAVEQSEASEVPTDVALVNEADNVVERQDADAPAAQEDASKPQEMPGATAEEPAEAEGIKQGSEQGVTVLE